MSWTDEVTAMKRTLKLTLLAAACVLPQTARAQFSAAGAPAGTVRLNQPPASPQYSGSGGQVAPVAYQAPAASAPEGVQQTSRKIVAGLGARMAGQDPTAPPVSPYTPMYGPIYTPASQQVPGVPYYGPDGMITTRIGNEDEWDETGPVEKFLTQLSFNTYWRFEYLLWRIERPGDEYLGAELPSTVNPESFDVFDDQDPPNLLGTGRVFNTRGISLTDNNGLRLTVGVPLTFGAFEVSGFALQQADQLLHSGELPSTSQFVVTPLSQGGAPATTGLRHDQFFDVNYTTDIYGFQTKVIFDRSPPGEGFKLNPLVGFQFVDIQEQMTQTGGASDISTGGILTSIIDSDTNNNVWGPTVGFRAELVHRWFTVGVEPKVAIAFNNYQARVRTLNLRGTEDGQFTTRDRSIDFSPIFETNAYARLHLSESVTLTAAANYFFVYQVARPVDSIQYGDNGDFPTPPGVVVDADLRDIWFRGLSCGLEITLP